ncbi:MAG: MaoC family dehydratase [Rhizobacter sp.]|nr:MaoC family dehydratase [Rhizobacter sp.]
MKFAEFYTGQVLTRGPVTLSEDDITSFARQWDPQWFHTDPDAADRGPFQGLIASGWHSCALAMRIACEAVFDGSESFASPGVSYIRWPRPVRPGEPLMWRAEMLEVRRSAQRPHLGVLRWRWQLFTQAGGHEVLDLETTSLFDLSGRAAKAGRAERP